MRPTAGRSTSTTRALALVAALALPALSACGAGTSAGAVPSGAPTAPAVAPAVGSVQLESATVARTQAAWAREVSAAASGAGAAVPAGRVGGVALGVDSQTRSDVRYVSQPDQRRVLRIDGKVQCVVVAAAAPASDGPAWCDSKAVATSALVQPTALATNEGGDLFIADPAGHRVYMLKSGASAPVEVAGTGRAGTPSEGAVATASSLSAPSGVAASLDGSRLYIADSDARVVLAVDTSKIATQWSFAAARVAEVSDAGDTSNTGAGASSPDTSGRVYVVAGPGCAPAEGTRPVRQAVIDGRTASLATPLALTIDSDDDLFLGDPGNHQVYRIVPGALGEQSLLIPVSTDAPKLMNPVSLALSQGFPDNQLVAVDAQASGSFAVVRADSTSSEPAWEAVESDAKRPAVVGGRWGAMAVGDDANGELASLTLPKAPWEWNRRAELTVTAKAPTCAAAPTSQPSSSSSPTSSPSGDRDRDFTPQSTPSSSRPKVPGNAVVPDPGAHRFSGNDRVATSVDTSQKLFPKAGSVPVVVISSASSYADSAGGARYAAEKGGSLLLTPGKKLDPAVEAEVRRSLAAGGSIVVTGREDAITPSVFSALEAIAPGRTERIGGVDRYETATELAQRLADQMTTTATGPIYLVTGADYPDALVVVSLARRTGGLIVLSKEDVLPPFTKALLQQMDPTGARTVPVGGAATAAAASLGGDAGRTAAAAAVVGSDRYETARKVAERFVALDTAAGARTDVVGLATGTTWPDALVGSTAMGTLVGPLLLTHGDQLDPNVVKALAAIPSSRPSTTVVFGGESAVPASVMAAFGAATRG